MITANQELDDLFHALADTTRRGILLRVRERDLSVNEIAARFSISLPAVSKHLGVLERAGLISRRKEGRKRICRAIPERLETAAEWLEFYRAFWSDNLDNLKQFVEQEPPPNRPGGRNMNDSGIKLVLTKHVQAPVEAVFNAWTDPARMKQWFAPGNMEVPSTEVDLRVGGTYRVHMRDPDSGSDYIVSGQYHEIVPNERLVFDWMWKDGVDRTEVTVEFEAHNGGTLVTLTHRGFSQQEFADKHNEGWTGCLDNMVAHLEHPLAEAGS